MITFLNEVSSNSNTLGGKAKNLVRLLEMGVQVPMAFVITTDAYMTYIDHNDIKSKIQSILKQNLSPQDQSRQIQELFSLNRMPGEVEKAILQGFRRLSCDRVAVRSSSSLEDLQHMSFAGQYSSYLGVRESTLMEAVIDCWKSLWNARAISYRSKNEMKDFPLHAVLVQEMVRADRAGVVFTANPSNGIRDEYVVNASFGLGEAIVSGQVMPDEYVYNVNKQELVHQRIHTKAKQIVMDDQGVKTEDISKEKQKLSVLSPNDIKRLVKVAQSIHNNFACPQDIEFAFDTKDNIYILQSRDITTLFPIDAFELDGKLRPHLCASSVLLGMKEAFTPLGANIYGGMFPKVLEVMTQSKKQIPDTFVKYAGARIYLDISYLMASRFVSKQFASAFSGSDLPLKDTMQSVLDKHGKTFRSQGIRFKIPWGILKYSMSMLGPYKRASKTPAEDKYGAIIELGQDLVEELRLESKSLKTLKDKLDFCDQAMMRVFILTQKQAMYCTEVASITNIEKKVKKLFGQRYNLDVLTYSLPGCITVEMSKDLNKLAKHFSENKLIPNQKDAHFKAFINKFGHRGTIELDAGTPRWREDPSYLLKQISTYMTDQSYKDNLKAHEEGRIKADQLIKEITEESAKIKGKKYAKKLENSMISYRRAAGMREYPKYNILQVLDIIRQVILEEGEYMVKEGFIDQANDVFYLRRETLLKGLHPKEDLTEHIQDNKKMYLNEMKRTSIPRIVLNSGETFYSGLSQAKSDGSLVGYSLSSGVCEGRVRIVHDPQNSELLPGEIMVAESTNPAWTPLFMIAKGLILEYGGPLSHGGIVARECGIPAVVGISTATSVLKNGQLVRVDGSSGIVEILD